MEGRRVSRKPRRNPLYMLFMSLLALTVVLLVTVFVLNMKLRSARRDLADAQTKIEQLQKGSSQSSDLLDDSGTGTEGSAGDGSTAGDTQTNVSGGDVIDWLDLTGHDEVAVKPSSVYDKYYIYYTTGGVNLRGGPGTSYDKITTVSLGTEVQAAAKQDGWTFVTVGGQFGWINSDYLVTTLPAPMIQRKEQARGLLLFCVRLFSAAALIPE